MAGLIMTSAGIKATQRVQLQQALLAFIKSNPQAEQLYQHVIAHSDLQLHVIDEATPVPTPDSHTIVVRLSAPLASAEPAQLRQELEKDPSIFYPLLVEMCYAANSQLHETGPRVVDFANARAWIEFGKRETTISFEQAQDVIEHGVANCGWPQENIPAYDNAAVTRRYQQQYQQAERQNHVNLGTIVSGVQAHQIASVAIDVAITTLTNAAETHAQDNQVWGNGYGRMQANPDNPTKEYVKELQAKQQYLNEWMQQLQQQRSDINALHKRTCSLYERDMVQLSSSIKTAAASLNQATPSQRSTARRAIAGLAEKISASTVQFQNYQQQHDAQLKRLMQAERDVAELEKQLHAKQMAVLVQKLASVTEKSNARGPFFENGTNRPTVASKKGDAPSPKKPPV